MQHARGRRLVRTIVAVTALVAVAGSAPGGAESSRAGAAATAGSRASARIIAPSGAVIGQALFTAEGGATRVRVAVSGLAPGFHGLHVHAGSACTGDFVASGGGHHDPAGVGHGAHDGDLPTLVADAAGRAALEVVTDRFTVEEVVGKVLMVHAGRDNQANVPARYRSMAAGAPASGPDATTLATGDAGGRVGCGPITSGAGDPTGGYRIVRASGSVSDHGGAPDVNAVARPGGPIVGGAATPTQAGYWLAGADGRVLPFGDASSHGSAAGLALARPVVGVAAQPADARAVVVAPSGAVLGHAQLTDEGGRTRVRVEVSGLTPGFHGLHVHAGGACVGDFVASGGGHHDPTAAGHGAHAGDLPTLFADARGTASAEVVVDTFTVDEVVGRVLMVHAGRDNQANLPVRYSSSDPGATASGPDPTTLATGDAGGRVGCGVLARTGGSAEDGYWLVAADGGVFAFGDAGFFGSLGGRALAAPVVGMASTPTGDGYWLVAADGGVFAFGDAGFFGSLGGRALAAPVVGMASTPTGDGYWLVAADGGVFAFGDARFLGSLGGSPVGHPVVGIAATPTGGGYRLVAADGGIAVFGDADHRGEEVTTGGAATVVAVIPKDR